MHLDKLAALARHAPGWGGAALDEDRSCCTLGRKAKYCCSWGRSYCTCRGGDALEEELWVEHTLEPKSA
ncbi:XRE family transcriptional regulator [Sesbania bispinosa]|nr:XRE family transcriptional regulator [Sesbania bispinosa]